MLIARDNRNVNNNILANLKKIINAIITFLPLEYPKLNMIVLGDLQHTIINNNLYHKEKNYVSTTVDLITPL